MLILVVPIAGAFAGDEDLTKLEIELWGYARDKKFDKLETWFAPDYQLINEHGAKGRKAALEAIRKYDLSDFRLSDFKVARTGPVVVLSYFAEVAETIDGKRIQKLKAPRVSVWLKTDKGWKTVAHVNLNPVTFKLLQN